MAEPADCAISLPLPLPLPPSPLAWKPITHDSLPGPGDEVLRRSGNGWDVSTAEWGTIRYRPRCLSAEEWLEIGYQWFRPISPPVLVAVSPPVLISPTVSNPLSGRYSDHGFAPDNPPSAR